MGKTYIGIDPGAKSMLTTQRDGVFEHFSILEDGIEGYAQVLKNIKEETNGNCVCVMEEIHAIFGSSAKATFSFGEIYGKLQGLLIAYQIPFHLVQPKQWQKGMWSNTDMVCSYKDVISKGKATKRKVVNTKQTSMNACKRLFPNIDQRRNDRCKNPDDNKVDSVLLCEYARRMNF